MGEKGNLVAGVAAVVPSDMTTRMADAAAGLAGDTAEALKDKALDAAVGAAVVGTVEAVRRRDDGEEADDGEAGDGRKKTDDLGEDEATT